MQIILDNLPWFLMFLGVLLFVESAYYLILDWRQSGTRTVNRRLRMLRASPRKQQALRRRLRSQQDPVSRAFARVLPPVDRLVARSGLSITVPRFALLVVATQSLLAACAYGLAHLPLIAAVVFGGTLGFFVPLLTLRVLAHRRTKKFAEQLPDALNLMVRSLKAGHPISVTMSTVARESADPIGTEFGLAVDEMTYGLSISEAMENMARRVAVEDLDIVVAAVQIQHQVGGNLAEVLANIETVVRDRFRMFAKVRAVSAEGRMSGWMIGLVPVVVWAVLMLLKPGYYGAVSDDPLFKVLISVAIGLWVVGQFTIWRLVSFRV